MIAMPHSNAPLPTSGPIDVEIPARELARLLRWPLDQPVTEPTAALIAEVRRWFAEHGQPWRHARLLDIHAIVGSHVALSDGTRLTSPVLAEQLRDAQADQLVVMAATAGQAIDTRTAKLWQQDRPDLAFVLDAYGSAVVEQLLRNTRDALCGWADHRGQVVLRHLSPGYQGWPLADQAQLLRLIDKDPRRADDLPIDALTSGSLSPKKSQLAVVGLTRRTDLVEQVDGAIACTRCTLRDCEFRRLPAQFAEETFASSLTTPRPEAER